MLAVLLYGSGRCMMTLRVNLLKVSMFVKVVLEPRVTTIPVLPCLGALVRLRYNWLNYVGPMTCVRGLLAVPIWWCSLISRPLRTVTETFAVVPTWARTRCLGSGLGCARVRWLSRPDRVLSLGGPASVLVVVISVVTLPLVGRAVVVVMVLVGVGVVDGLVVVDLLVQLLVCVLCARLLPKLLLRSGSMTLPGTLVWPR